VAADFFEKGSLGFVGEGGQADESSLGVAAAGLRVSWGGLNGGAGGQAGSAPEAEPTWTEAVASVESAAFMNPGRG